MTSIARKKIEGRLVGGSYTDLANYSDLFERTHDSILLLDLNSFEVLQCNPACTQTLGVEAADLVGQELPSFFDEFTRARLEIFLKQAPQGSIDLKWVSTKSSMILEISVSRLELADYCSVLQLIARDVTAVREHQARLELMSVTDELTGLNNRRAFNQALERVHQLAEKTGVVYAVLLLDVDHFKHFNDRNGHAAGDLALKEVAKILGSHRGAEKTPARYGGEEFALILSATEVQAVHELAERIRAAIQNAQVPCAEHQPLGFLSVSIGGSFWEKGLSSQKVLERADSALYESKGNGRNRVIFQ